MRKLGNITLFFCRPWREPLWALNGMQKSEEEKLEAVKRKYVNAKLYVISENIKINITYIMYVLRGSCGYLWPSTEKKVKLALYNFLCIITTTRCSLEFSKWLNRAPFGPIFAHILRFCLVCSILKACHIWHQLVCLVSLSICLCNGKASKRQIWLMGSKI